MGQTIYPQMIYGTYRSLKNYAIFILFLVYFGGSWLRWDRGAGLPDQALLIDLPNRRAYLFGIEIWPDEIYYITGSLILAAMGLFFVTSLFGRIWCGYACPHTVFVDLFRYVEHYFQGDRNERMRLATQPMTPEKFRKKFYTHLSWLAISFSFAFGWVCYFYNAPSLAMDLIRCQVESNAILWLSGLTFSTYLFAGYIRERMCMHMCPYGRFQSAMVDQNTYVVTYHNWRGEPRGSYDPNNQALGDCIDCNKCVVVCPMGIDIRDGLQMACIGCGLCVDACNTVMSKLGREPDLIAYDSMATTHTKHGHQPLNMSFFRIKTAMFATIFGVVTTLMLYSLAHKPLYKMVIARERGALFTITPDGSIRNTYQLKIFNRTHHVQSFTLTAEGLANLMLSSAEMPHYQPNLTLTIAAESELEQKVFIAAPSMPALPNAKQISIILRLTPTEDASTQPLEKQTIFATPGE